MIKKLKKWIIATRYHTLLLSFSGVTSSFILSISKFKKINIDKINIYILCVVTSVLLQILSNFSNDYGHTVKDKFNKRIGSIRLVKKSIISKKEMKIMIYIISVLSFFFGYYLIYKSFNFFFIKRNNIFYIYLFGLFLSIYCSITYSIGGPLSYGDKALGDLFVLIFFGIISISGSYFLYTFQVPSTDIFLFSLSIGLLNVAVLNLNNIRDIESDCKCNKITIANFIGEKNAKVYHALIILFSIFFSGIFILIRDNNNNIFQWILFLVISVYLIFHIRTILTLKKKKLYTKELIKLIYIIFIYSISLSFSYYLL